MTYFPMLFQENPSRLDLCVDVKGKLYYHVQEEDFFPSLGEENVFSRSPSTAKDFYDFRKNKQMKHKTENEQNV